MTETAEQIMSSLERLNSILNKTVLTQEEIVNGRKAVENIRKNVHIFKKVIDSTKIFKFDKNDLDAAKLKKLSRCLEHITHDFYSIHQLIVAAKV